MDVLNSFACLLVGIALPLALLFVVLRRGWRQLAVAEAYGEMSRRLGLPVDTRGVSLHGHVGGQRIWVGEVMVGHGPDRRMMCWGVLDLERPLGLGILMRRRGLSERVFRRARSPEVALPDAEMERLLEVHGDDPRRVRSLLTDDVLAALRHLLLRWRDVVVTDRAVRVHLKQPLAAPDELQDLIDGLFQLATVLHQARAAIGPPPSLEPLIHDLTQIAEVTGLEVDGSYPALQGIIDGRQVQLVPHRSNQGHTMELNVYFGDQAKLGLQIEPQVAPDGYWSVGQDIQFDDEAFDAAFVVKGWDPDGVRELLTTEAREALLALHSLGALEVTDVSVQVRRLPLDDTTLAEAVALGTAAATALRRTTSLAASPGAAAPPL